MYASPGEYGIFLHCVDPAGDPQTLGGSDVAPIEWDPQQQGWIVDPTTVVTTCKPMGCFPLRMRPKPGASDAGFDEFMDAMFDPLLSADAELVGSEAAEAEAVRVAGVDEAVAATEAVMITGAGAESALGRSVELVEAAVPRRVPCEILDSKEVKGQMMLLVEWKGDGRLRTGRSRTWEPLKSLDCPELIAAFREQRKGLVAATAHVAAMEMTSGERVGRDVWGSSWRDGVDSMVYVLSAEGEEGDAVGRAVHELVRKHRLTGDETGWRAAYESEFGSVAGLRLLELSEHEAAAVRESLEC